MANLAAAAVLAAMLPSENVRPAAGPSVRPVWHHPDGRMAKLKVRDFPESTP